MWGVTRACRPPGWPGASGRGACAPGDRGVWGVRWLPAGWGSAALADALRGWALAALALCAVLACEEPEPVDAGAPDVGAPCLPEPCECIRRGDSWEGEVMPGVRECPDVRCVCPECREGEGERWPCWSGGGYGSRHCIGGTWVRRDCAGEGR